MKGMRFLLVWLFATNAFGGDWKMAEAGWQYQFPRDHHTHREFKTEWWYFTGNLLDTEGHRFGYELTFFRHGIRPAAARSPNSSRFIVDDLKFAHFAITDVNNREFRFDQMTSRGAFREAGFDNSERLAWIENWTLTNKEDGTFGLTASNSAGAIRLQLRPTKSPVIHGENGVSVKASDGQHASHYYSIPRLETIGELVMEGKSYSIHGQSWFDHEWATSQLAEGQAGWDWLCLQWDNETELMLYRMRLKNGQADASSSGTWIAADGTTTHLRSADFQMAPVAFWKSATNGVNYPTSWRVSLPKQQTQFVLRAKVENQELVIDPITYWEGAIEATGTQAGGTIKGYGYLELTGYAGRVGGVEALKR